MKDMYVQPQAGPGCRPARCFPTARARARRRPAAWPMAEGDLAKTSSGRHGRRRAGRARRGRGRRRRRRRSSSALLQRGQLALRHRLRALPRPAGRRRRHDRAARLPASADLPPARAARRARSPCVRRHHAGLRRDAVARRPTDARRIAGPIVAYVRALQAAQAVRRRGVAARARGALGGGIGRKGLVMRRHAADLVALGALLRRAAGAVAGAHDVLRVAGSPPGGSACWP